MDIPKLREAIRVWRENLSKRKGTIVSWGDAGPVDIGVIENLIKVLECQDERIKALERADVAPTASGLVKVTECNSSDYWASETVLKTSESLSQNVPQPTRKVSPHTAFKLDLFAEALHQLYENLRAIKNFVSDSYADRKFDPKKYNAFQCQTKHNLPDFPPLDPRCSQGASKRLYETVRNIRSLAELPADYNDLVQAAAKEGSVSLLTGFEELLSRATIKRIAPTQDRDRLGLPLKEYILAHLDDLTKDPLESAILKKLVILKQFGVRVSADRVVYRFADRYGASWQLYSVDHDRVVQ